MLESMQEEDRLEPAAAADAPEMARMSRHLIERGLAWRWTERRIRGVLRDADVASVVARRDPVLLGFALMQYDFSNRQAHLLLLAVAPTARRRGLGHGLVEWLEKIARLGGIRRVDLEVREDARESQAFYRRLGYHAVGRAPHYYEGRLGAVRMERLLEASSPGQ